MTPKKLKAQFAKTRIWFGIDHLIDDPANALIVSRVRDWREFIVLLNLNIEWPKARKSREKGGKPVSDAAIMAQALAAAEDHIERLPKLLATESEDIINSVYAITRAKAGKFLSSILPTYRKDKRLHSDSVAGLVAKKVLESGYIARLKAHPAPLKMIYTTIRAEANRYVKEHLSIGLTGVPSGNVTVFKLGEVGIRRKGKKFQVYTAKHTHGTFETLVDAVAMGEILLDLAGHDYISLVTYDFNTWGYVWRDFSEWYPDDEMAA